ncbi:hypothetical protein [Aeromonas veronii]|uniref:hypothetical protein n=1 Tax=Aeromonas veronii TaxID=654 RepID=UPI003D20AA4F
MRTTITNHEVTSVSNFTNEFGHGRQKLVINFARHKGIRKDLYKQTFNKIEVELIEVADISGSALKATRPFTVKESNRESHSNRAKAIKAIMPNETSYFTGMVKANADTSITVDMAVNANQRIAIVTEATVGTKNHKKTTIVFEKMDITAHGYVFNSKRFNLTTDEAANIVIKNVEKSDTMKAEQDEDQRAFALALELMENPQFVAKVLKHLDKLQAQEEAEAEELEDMFNRTAPTTEFDVAIATYVADTKSMKDIVEASQSAPTVCEEVAPTIATKTDDQAAFDYDETGSRKVLAHVAPDAEQATEAEKAVAYMVADYADATDAAKERLSLVVESTDLSGLTYSEAVETLENAIRALVQANLKKLPTPMHLRRTNYYDHAA